MSKRPQTATNMASKGKSQTNLTAENKTLKAKLDKADADLKLLRRHYAKTGAPAEAAKYDGDAMFQLYKDGYENACEQLKKIEGGADLMKSDLRGDEKKIEELEARLKELENERSSMQAKLQSLEKEVQLKSEKLPEIQKDPRSRVTSLEVQVKDLKATVGKKEAELLRHTQRLPEILGQRHSSKLEDDISKLQAENDALSRNLSGLGDDLNERARENAILNANNEKRRQEVSNLEKEKVNLELSIKDLRQQLSDSFRQTSTSRQQQDEYRQLAEKTAEQEKMIKDLQAEVFQKTEDVKNMTKTVTDCNRDKRKLESELSELKIKLESAPTSVENNLEDQTVKLREELKAKKLEFEQKIKGLQKELKAKEEAFVSKEKELKEIADQTRSESKNLKREVSLLREQGPTESENKSSLIESKRKIEALEAEKSKLEDACHEAFVKLEEKDKRMQAEVKKNAELVADTKKKVDVLERNLSNAQKDAAEAKSEASDLKKQVEELKNKKPESGDTNGMKNLLEEKDRSLTEAHGKIENLAAEKKRLEQKCHEAFVQIETKDKENKAKEKESKQLIERKEKTINELRREASMNNSDDLQSKLDKVQRELVQSKNRNATLEKEVEDLKMRLSKMAGAQLMDDNPNISDLSDENRATKLGEKFSELYDDHWTDAFEECDGQEDEITIKDLYDLLRRIFLCCSELSEVQAKEMRAMVLRLPGSKTTPANTEIPLTKQKQLKELRKSFATDVLQDVKQHCKDQLKVDFRGKTQTEKYFNRCVELCWLMSVQDPPVVLEDPPAAGAPFDTNVYKAYTKTGKTFAYIVWPTLLLHKNGPTLCKGVAQAK